MSAYARVEAAIGILPHRSGMAQRTNQVMRARPGHTETGLATRALFGTAPNFPEGMTAAHVVQVILDGISAGKPLIASSEF